MKIKRFLAIKILCFALSGLLFSSSVFLNNAKAITVRAESTDVNDIIQSVIQVVLSGLGIYFSGVNPVTILTMASSGSNLIDTIGDYVRDNNDGTYTIDAELIQLVNDIICNDYIDGQVDLGENGFYNYGASEIYFHRIETDPSNGTQSEIEQKTRYDAFNSKKPVVAIMEKTSSSPFNMTYYLYTLRDGSVYQLSASDMGNTIGKVYIDNLISGTITTWSKYTYGGSQMAYSCNYADSQYEFTYSIPFPVFDSITTATNALLSGDYTDAINYRANTFETSSRFTGLPYTGGDVTVTYNVLNGIEDKVMELDGTDKTVDEKIDALQDYINGNDGAADDTVTDGDSSTNNGSSGGGFLSSLGDFIGKIFDFFLSIIEMLFDPIIQLLDMFMELINKVIDIIPTGFTLFLGAIFPFFPEEWSTIISLGLLILIIVSLFRRK